MHDHMENIPENISDWLEQHPFENLGAAEQQLVLQHMSRDEYNRLHETSRILHSEPVPEPEPGEAVKQKLLQQFNRLHTEKPGRRNILLTPLPLWRVAASWLLLAGSMFLLLQNRPV